MFVNGISGSHFRVLQKAFSHWDARLFEEELACCGDLKSSFIGQVMIVVLETFFSIGDGECVDLFFMV